MEKDIATITSLDAIQQVLEADIAYAAITETEDLFHEEEDQIIRAFTFSRGTRKTIAVIGSDGYLHYYGHFGKRVSERLLPDICACLLWHLVASSAGTDP